MSDTQSTIPLQSIKEPIDHTKTLFELMGGEDAVRSLVDRFYDLMELDHDFEALRATHGPDLSMARDKLFWFLCGWLGGPNYYQERFGHPRLRARHLPFSIGVQERDQWVACMGRAMLQEKVPEVLIERLLSSFFQTADWMRNRDE